MSSFRLVPLALLAPWVGDTALAWQVTSDTYTRAERMLPPNAEALVLRDRIRPNWIDGSDRFWYRVTTDRGTEFIYVDPDRRIRLPAFDHARLAGSLGRALDTSLSADSLPFRDLAWHRDGKTETIMVRLRSRSWRCDLDLYRCRAVTSPAPPDPDELLSPDGRWALSVREHDLWLRDTRSGQVRRLTTDGTRRFDYAGSAESNTRWVTANRHRFPAPPRALWSPDSKKFLTHKLDQRRVPEAHLLQSVPEGGGRPRLWSFAFPFPGDSLSLSTWRIVEVETGRLIEVDAPPQQVPYEPPLVFQDAWWGDSAGTRAYYLDRARGAKSFRLMEVEAGTGRTRVVAEERGPTMVEPTLSLGARPNIRVSQDGKELIWFSERDDWGHLYLLDAATGAIKHRMTEGAFAGRELVRVDETARRIWFTAGGREAGRDPYYRHLYSAGFDGSDLRLVTPEDADHELVVSPSGRWVVDRWSRVDLAPTTVVRSMDGAVVVPLEKADVTRLLATGWRYPERFKVKAADGVTDIYGVLVLPSTFDSTRRYPVIEEIYPGPQSTAVPKAFVPGSDLHALAELGMVGVVVDGRGTPFRSKAFHDYSYGRLENAGGLEDHLAAYRQLAGKRPWLDLDRVGIYGHSAGGYASTRALLQYPEFYKVAVSSAGNHDLRHNIAIWGETYQGMPAGDNYAAYPNASLAGNLTGKLMLAFGEMDDNVPPALTIQLIDALGKANKDYDLLVVPNGSHAMHFNPYFRRRRWDYFVRQLMAMEPPAGYEIKTPPEYPY